MLAVLWSAIGLNKWLAYGILAATLLSAVAIAVLRVRAGGIQSERAKQMTESLSNLQKEARERARIESMRTSDIRKQLRNKWSYR